MIMCIFFVVCAFPYHGKGAAKQQQQQQKDGIVATLAVVT